MQCRILAGFAGKKRLGAELDQDLFLSFLFAGVLEWEWDGECPGELSMAEPAAGTAVIEIGPTSHPKVIPTSSSAPGLEGVGLQTIGQHHGDGCVVAEVQGNGGQFVQNLQGQSQAGLMRKTSYVHEAVDTAPDFILFCLEGSLCSGDESHQLGIIL